MSRPNRLKGIAVEGAAIVLGAAFWFGLVATVGISTVRKPVPTAAASIGEPTLVKRTGFSDGWIERISRPPGPRQ